MKPQINGELKGRRLEFFHHTSEKAWGYEQEQTDTFAVLYPKDYEEGKKYPLDVVFHSAGHDVYSTVACLWDKGNHDIYHVPEHMFGVFLDCKAHKDDWWWGGINALGDGDPCRRGVQQQPVENRCIATVEWVIANYNIDTQRVYAVGNSMGGSGALGVALCRGDIFAAIKVNVPAGVRHAADRCCLDTEAPKGFKIPDPPVVVDYSAQDDKWSGGHEVLYEGMRSRRYSLHGYWGEFGHANNNSVIEKKNDLVHSLDVLSMTKDTAYPVFTNASTDDIVPWIDKENCASAGQVNGFFRWRVVCDTKDKLQMELWLLNADEWTTRVELPKSAKADVLIRRMQNFTLSENEEFEWTLTSEDGSSCGGVCLPWDKDHPAIDGICITREKQLLTLTKIHK